MIWLALILLFVAGRVVWELESRRRERRIEEERLRAAQVHAFGVALAAVAPELISSSTLRDVEGSPGASATSRADVLLDSLDEIDGPVLGRCTTQSGHGWPFVAWRHTTRDIEPHRLVTAHSLPLILPTPLRSRHVFAIGKSGMGKSCLLTNVILQDARAGEGIGVIAPEHEFLADEILPFLPAHRIDDVIYVNPADVARPVPLNPLHVDPGESFDLKLEETFSVLLRAIAEDGTSGAPRMEIILRYVLAALMAVPNMTLLDIPRLLDRTDATFRTWVVDQLAGEDVRHFWKATYPAFPKDAHLSLLNRLGRFLQPKVVRAILCQPGRSLNVRRAMDDGRLLLVNLSDGLLGEQNAQILGQLIVAKIQLAAMSRANIPPHTRRRFHLVVDEFQAFCSVSGTSYERMLSRSRKYAVALTLAQQQFGSIPEQVSREILGNVSNLVIFRVGATDARRLGHELAGAVPHFDHRVLTGLRKHVACCLLDRTMTLVDTNPPPQGGSDAVRDAVIRHSRERYGVEPRGPRGTAGSAELEAFGLGDVF